jgi:hypothetical protein
MNKLIALFVTFLFPIVSFSQTDVLYSSKTSGTSKGEPIKIDQTESTVIFQDDFNGDNTETGLNSRGWITLNVDGGGTTSWFQGNPTVFSAYEGPTNGYVGQNFNGANGFLINQWLISPPITVNAGDTLSFWHRSPDASIYDDSIYVRYSTTAGTTPNDFDVTWGRYKVSNAGWAKWTGTFQHSGTVRFAIQYYHTNGGPSGNYSDYFGLDFLKVTSGSSTARVQVIHNSADVLAGAVDVYINGTLAIDNFAFRQATPFIDLPAGVTLNIGIAPGNSTSVNDTLKNFPVVLAAGEKYVVFANGVLTSGYAPNPDGRNISFTLFVKPQARETGTGSGVDIFVLHGSTDAPTVDVKAREAGNLVLVNDAAYGDITPYFTVPANDYTLDLYLADGVTLVNSFIAPLSGLGGSSLAVFASGFLNPSANQNGAPFGLFAALANGTVVQLVPGVVPVELSSFTATVNGTSVSLNWTTVTETNNRGFEIQRKSSDNDFVTVGFVNGKGTTTQIQNYSFTESNLSVGKYAYRLKQIDFDGTFEYSKVVEVSVVAPREFSLEQNFPNPFNPSTMISFNLKTDADVTLKIFNLLGQEITTLVNGRLTAGTQQISFNAEDQTSGVYFYRIDAKGIDGTNFSSTKKMILSR